MTIFITVLCIIGIIFCASLLAEYFDKKEWENFKKSEKRQKTEIRRVK